MEISSVQAAVVASSLPLSGPPQNGENADEPAADRVAEAVSGAGVAARAGFARAVESTLAAAGAEVPETAEESADGLTEAERQQVEELAARDREVRNHEQAHVLAGRPWAGQPSYTYQTGPDGKAYAIGGEVPIDTAPIPGDPEATIEKMRVVAAAAMAPAEPSGQDRKVAAAANAMALEAQAELMAQRSAEAEEAAEARNPETRTPVAGDGDDPGAGPGAAAAQSPGTDGRA